VGTEIRWNTFRAYHQRILVKLNIKYGNTNTNDNSWNNDVY